MKPRETANAGVTNKRTQNNMSEAETWLARQPKLANGKVSITLIIAEGQKRGYCICPKPLRQLISFDGLHCQWCQQIEDKRSWQFWYNEPR